MKPNQSKTSEKYTISMERWALLLALMTVGLLIGFLLVGADTRGKLSQPAPGNLYASIGDQGVDHGAMDHTPAQEAHNHQTSKYACPMMCVPPSDKPGRCPVCGMALAKVASQDQLSDGSLPRLRLSPRAVHLAEIQTLPALRMAVANAVRLFGQIDFDSAHTTDITAFMPGVIDRVYVKRAGQFVRWGDPLFDIYSTDLLETQRQLVDAMRYVPSFLAFQANTPHVAQDVPIQNRKGRAAGSEHSTAQREALLQIKALRHKLSILGLPKRDIDQFMKKGEATGIATVYAPMYGQITVQNATEGTFINTGTSLFTIADPKYVWARLDVYESDYPWIRIGQRVTFTTEAYPGEVFEARVGYIDPVFNPATRTFSIGAMTTQDQGGRLKAGMLIRAEAHARLDVDGNLASTSAAKQRLPLVIPVSAPLITGTRAVVYVAVAGDTPVFEGREVVLGPRAKDHYVVRSGLTEGEQVVVNGSFKIDSAMQILAKPSLMSPDGDAHSTGHQHNGHQPGATRVQGDGASHMVMDPGPKDAGDASQEHSLADEHQHPELSRQMHVDYMNQRRASRMETPMHMQTAGPPATDAGNHSHGPAIGDHRQSPEDPRSHGNRLVRRRKPGQYGDTTRQGASQLEEHRLRWRGKAVHNSPK